MGIRDEMSVVVLRVGGTSLERREIETHEK